MNYGTLVLDGAARRWRITCPPHVSIFLKRNFPSIPAGSAGTHEVSDTLENCRTLRWFLQRYPMDSDHLPYLTQQAAKHKDRISLIEQIMGGQYEGKAIDFGALPHAPREYQKIAAQMALARGGLLVADQVGLGKSFLAILTLCAGWTLPAVVVTLNGPMLRQWGDQIDKFAPHLTWHIAKKGTPYDIRGKRSGLLPDVLILNYAKLTGWSEWLVAAGYASVTMDEIQEMRHRDTDRYQATMYLVRNTKLRIGLSATPIFNFGGEAYNILDMLFPDQIGTPEEFGLAWCNGTSSEKGIIKDTRAFHHYLTEEGLMVRRTRAQVGRELPKVDTQVLFVDSDPKVFHDVEDRCAAMARIILTESKLAPGAKMRAGGEIDALLRQATGLAKSQFVAEFVRLILESGEKVVLYGWHRAVYAVWKEHLKEFNPVFITGTESSTEKQKSKDAFISGNSQLLIVSLRAGAGIDGLQQVCHIVVFGELDWAAGIYVQCIGRVDRDGQAQSVLVYFLLARDGSDPIVAEVNGIKRQQLEGIMGVETNNGDLIDNLQTDPKHIRKLAEDYLRAHKNKKGAPSEVLETP